MREIIKKLWLEIKEWDLLGKILMCFLAIAFLLCLYAIATNINNPEFWKEFREFMKERIVT